MYIADAGNLRIQIFKQISLLENSKAIVVAGGGPIDNLWDATQMSANFAYRTLTYQGYTKESIFYLTSDTDLDLDNNGEPDDVDRDATNENLQYAITEWAEDADSLVLYLVDHGGVGTFRMSDTETLSATDLHSWLTTLQQSLPGEGKVIVVYDACESGTFQSALSDPPAGKQRLVITSTSPGQEAQFVTQGTISFSNFFWTHIFSGETIRDAFELAVQAMSFAVNEQTPLLDADGDGIGNETNDYILVENMYIGNGTTTHQGQAPVIGSVSPAQTIDGTNGTTSAILTAYDITDDDGIDDSIARVWAVIRPPDYSQGSTDNPVLSLPSIDLLPVGESQYEATYTNFTIEGTYWIAIYARDSVGNTSVPKLTTVSVNNPLRRRAIIVAGGSETADLWPAIEKNASSAYEALRFQGYSDDDDIYLLSPVSIPGVTTFPYEAVLSNLEYAITGWAADSTQDLVLYLIGDGDEETYQLNDTETLSAAELDSWLDTLQTTLPGKATVIYDGDYSGSFLDLHNNEEPDNPALAPPDGKERILIASTGDGPTYFLSEGDISFSKYFWNRVMNGTNVEDSFIYAKNAMGVTNSTQVARLDDNGNGISNEKSDGVLARDYTIGVGIILAGDNPLIGSIMEETSLRGEKSSTIWVEDVTTTGTIDRVWAVITPPGFSPALPDTTVPEPPSLILSPVGNNRYEGVYDNFTESGVYRITVYAMDDEGNISFPAQTSVCTISFSDVPSSNWAGEYISAIGCNEITTGCGGGNYCLSNNVTRAEMAVFIIRTVEGEPPDDYCGTTAPFDDVSAGHWACGYIKRLSELGITGGCGGDNFCPASHVTRAQMAAFIIRAIEGEPPNDYCGTTNPFDDVSHSFWACKYIKRLVELGITTGCTGTEFCPETHVTRAQMAAFLARAFLGME
jgi:hypothetical protein